METTEKPITLQLGEHGSIEGKTITDPATGKDLCHYYGGVSYGLPTGKLFRWKRSRPLPRHYRYPPQTKLDGCKYTNECPQPQYLDEDLSTRLWDEDCLESNLWVPAGEPPDGGWPVFFYIHGGFLQFGSPNGEDFGPLIGEMECKVIVVTPAYRLNLFGFLASKELLEENPEVPGTGNYGFWDQRTALEWTRDYIGYFGGNPEQITVGGLSAGAHSAFHQLAHDLLQSTDPPLIKRCVLFSNGPGVQPRTIAATQSQFDAFCSAVPFIMDVPPEDRPEQLRVSPIMDLLAGAQSLARHQFRAVTDDAFVSSSLFTSLDDGTFAAKMIERNVQLLVSEVRDEHTSYAQWRPPVANTRAAVRERLEADYPLPVVDALLAHYCGSDGDGGLPPGMKDWPTLFGHIYAAVQVHATLRGFCRQLGRHGAGHLVRRVRIEYMTSATKKSVPKEEGVTHGTDLALWFWGCREMLSRTEKKVVRNAVGEGFARLVRGDEEGERQWWGTGDDMREVRRVKDDGSVVIEKDKDWDEGCRVWDLLREASQVDEVGYSGSGI